VEGCYTRDWVDYEPMAFYSAVALSSDVGDGSRTTAALAAALAAAVAAAVATQLAGHLGCFGLLWSRTKESTRRRSR